MSQIQAKLQDGTILEFPEGTADEVIDRVVQTHIVQQAQAAKYPSAQERGLPTGQTPSPADFGPQGSALSRFAGSIGRAIDPRPLYNKIMENPAGPLGTGPIGHLGAGILSSHMDQAKKALNAPTWSEAFGHGLAAVTPVVGPIAAQIGEQAGSGDFAGALGTGTMLAGPYVASKAIGALAPKAGGALKQSAAGSFERAMQPTTKINKAKAAKVAPAMVERKVTAMTQKGLQGKMQSGLAEAGEALEGGLAKVPANAMAEVRTTLDAIEKSKVDSGAVIAGAKGPVVVDPIVVQGADALKKIVTDMADAGGKTPYHSLRKLRQYWDKEIAKGGGFMDPNIDKLLDLKRDGTAAMRAELVKPNPDLAALNAEYSIWKNGADVMRDTILRKKGQSVPMGEQMATAAGAAGGLASRGLSAAIGNAAMFRVLIKAMRSTGWRTVSAQAKSQLADALMSGNQQFINTVILKIGSEAGKASPEQQEP